MSTVNRWSKMAGLLNEAAEPQSQEQEVHESTQELPVSESIMNAEMLRSLISEIANEILNEARASRVQGEVIQRALNNLMLNQPGFPIDDDGLYGRKTSDAVKAYQREEGLKADGVAGPSTLFAMHTDLVNKYAGSSDSAAQALISDFSFAKSPLGLTGEMGKSNIVFGKRIGKAEPAKKKPAAPKAPEAPAKKRKTLTVANAEEPSKAEADTIDDFLEDLGEDMTDEERRASAEASAYVALQKVGAGDPGDEEDLDMTMSALLPGVSGYGADAWSRAVDLPDKTGGPTVAVISQQDWEAAGGPNLPDDVRVAEDPTLGK